MIWQRYIFKELCKTFLLFTCGFFALYALIDYAIHLKHFVNSPSLWKTVLLYYAIQFCAKAPLILGFGLTLAVLKVLCHLSTHRHQILLFGAGIGTKRLLRPVLLFALLIGILLWGNFALFAPKFDPSWHSQSEQLFYYDRVSKDGKTYHSVFLMDREGVLYQMHSLSIGEEQAIGHFVQKIVHREEGTEIEHFERMPVDLSWLFEEKHSTTIQRVYEALYPLLLMLLPFLFVPKALAFPPPTTRFLLYGTALALLVLLTTLMETALIISHYQDVLWPLFLPLLLLVLCHNSRRLITVKWRFSVRLRR